jgi:hypothetical protein
MIRFSSAPAAGASAAAPAAAVVAAVVEDELPHPAKDAAAIAPTSASEICFFIVKFPFSLYFYRPKYPFAL